MFGGDFTGGEWVGTHLGEKGLSLYLAEKEFHKLDLTPEGAFLVGPENDEEYIDLWFEDSRAEGTVWRMRGNTFKR